MTILNVTPCNGTGEVHIRWLLSELDRRDELIARLRKAFEGASHGSECASIPTRHELNLSAFWGFKLYRRPCNCWKSKVLEGAADGTGKAEG